MTRERAREIAATAFDERSLTHGICMDLILAACAEERQRCAEVVMQEAEKYPGPINLSFITLCAEAMQKLENR